MRPSLAVAVVALGACWRREPEPEEPALFRARVVDAGVDPGEPTPPIPVEIEVKGSISETKVDKVAGITIATVQAGANHGVRLDWTGTIVDAEGAVLGPFTIMEIRPRTTVGGTALAPKQLEGAFVRLVSPASSGPSPSGPP